MDVLQRDGDGGDGGGGGELAEHSSVCLNQTFPLSPTVMGDDE